MSDHADTIQQALGYLVQGGYRHTEAIAALDALLAERQQAIEALRRIASKTAEPPTSFGVRELSQVHHIARAALAQLGETP